MELARLNMSMPIQTDDEVLNEKAIIFAEELSNWSPETVSMAFREHARSSRYMPTLSEILTNCRTASQALEYKRQREHAELPMPDHLPEEVANNNLQCIKRLRDKIGRKVPKGKIGKAAIEERKAFLRHQAQILGGS